LGRLAWSQLRYRSAPAWLASRADPLAAVRPPVLAVRRGHQPGGITALAVVNTMRAPGRTLIGVLSLAVGVAALTLLTAVTVAYRGVVVGSLLGDAVAVQVRGVDYVAIAATVALGVLAVADAVFLNIRERGSELATIRSFGWRESSLARLVVTEGAVIGTAGSPRSAWPGRPSSPASSRWGCSRPPARRQRQGYWSPPRPRCSRPGCSVAGRPRTCSPRSN
jgi:putative ABC transport system permease protein